MGALLLEVALSGVGRVPRLERDAWSTIKRLRQTTNDYRPPSPLPDILYQVHRLGWRRLATTL